MTRLRITTVIGNGGNAWFHTDEMVREFFASNGLVERSHLGIPGVTAEPRPGEEFFLFFKPNSEGARQRRFKLVRADAGQGIVVDSGLITDVFSICRHGKAHHHMYQGMHGRLHRWTFFGEEVGLCGDALDFRYYLGTELN